MPFGYLVTVTFVAGCTLFALAPPRPRHSSPSNKSFWFGYLLNELPFLAFSWLLASTLLAFSQGDLASPGGWAALGVAVLTAVGLVIVAWRGLGAGPAVDHALDEGLGGGWRATVDPNYRLSPTARFPDHHVDAKKVIAWVRDHGPQYGADPTVLFVAGSSAGGHLAALAALTPDDPTFQPGFEDADTSVTAAICLYGYYGPLDTDQPVLSSPQAYVRADAPPFFVAHGDKDTMVLVEDARGFVARLQSTSLDPVVYAELPGASTPSTWSVPSASSRSWTGSRPSPPGCDHASRHGTCGPTGRRTLPEDNPDHCPRSTRRIEGRRPYPLLARCGR